MSGALSKRQQARNERTLQDLIKSIPGNSTCADCSARNPGWASWSLGVFLCMRCAAIHRKMGTHISKVKSLSMDSWSNDQVENMKRMGNIMSNRIYNPNNAKPPIPFDADEADSAMERFIRGKYAERAAAARHDTGSSTSDDHPPPLPPKTGSRFGFRSGASIFPLSSSKTRREPPPPVDIVPRRRRSPSPDFAPAPARKTENGGSGGSMDLAGKMARLKDMGFADPKRNLAVLNGLGGNLEKTIDTLVRLGEGNGNRAGDASSRGSRTPVTPAFPQNSPANGSNRSRDKPTPSPQNSSNPFDLLDVPQAAPPQSSQSTGSKANLQSSANTNPFLSPGMPTNPFGLSPSQSQYNLNAAFQNLDVSNQQNAQPLFPNHTGGFPVAQQQLQQSQNNPSVAQQYYSNQNGFPVQSQNTSYNPFLQQPVQHQQAQSVNSSFQSNPYTQSSMYSNSLEQSSQNPFPSSIFDQQSQQQLQQQQYSSTSVFDQGAQQQQQQQAQLQQSQQQSPQPQQQQYNPFFAQNNQQQQAPQQQAYGYQNQNQQQQYTLQHANTYPLPVQQPMRPDTRSIMDLFNYPQLAPSKPQQGGQENSPEQTQPQDQMFAVALPQQQQQQQHQQFLPQVQQTPQMGGSRNPFNIGGANPMQAQSQGGADILGSMPSFPQAQQQHNGSRHVSQESMSINAGGWQNGRHSPDAWGTISGRS